MKKLAVVMVFLVWFAAPAGADLDMGVAAYNRGDYATALRELKPLAEKGMAPAQFNLGVMYNFGEGVPQDDKEALRWYRLAAEQGHHLAQFILGSRYAAGDGVRQDYVQSYMWLSLAAAQGHKKASHARDLAAGQMSPSQIAKAQQLARKWKSKK